MSHRKQHVGWKKILFSFSVTFAWGKKCRAHWQADSWGPDQSVTKCHHLICQSALPFPGQLLLLCGGQSGTGVPRKHGIQRGGNERTKSVEELQEQKVQPWVTAPPTSRAPVASIHGGQPARAQRLLIMIAGQVGHPEIKDFYIAHGPRHSYTGLPKPQDIHWMSWIWGHLLAPDATKSTNL